MDKNLLFDKIGQFKKKSQGKIPSLLSTHKLLKDLLLFLFPLMAEDEEVCNVKKRFEEIRIHFSNLLCSMSYTVSQAEDLSQKFMHTLPAVYALLLQDARAVFQGDPAAKSQEEVLLTYPGFLAGSIYRLAREIYKLNIPLIPRIFTEYAHCCTGIDIHPGAQIGTHFCIDHGTGVVIGETSLVGNHVKIYQGVTIGALSVKKSMSAKKRHPTIEDNVIIYAGATILGGKTIIGKHSVIGGNVWLVESVEPYSLVTNTNRLQIRKKKPDTKKQPKGES